MDGKKDTFGRPHRVGMVSLGCAKNLVDSEVMLGELRARGYEITSRMEDAETVIVNTCGFIDEAKQESIEAILEAVGGKAHGVRQVLVAGCMANRYGAELRREIPEIDGFISLDQLREVGTLVQLGGAPAPPSVRSRLVFDHTSPRLVTTGAHAYLKVAEGCDNPCTFCAIPVWRGRFRSRTVSSLVEEARRLGEQGVQELVLVAQDTTRYGEDLGLGRHGLALLLEALLESTAFPWIRFLYAYPTTLDEEVLRLMGAEERLVSYLDMPLQHSHPEILKAMRRGGRAERYLRLLERARTLVPDIALRTTFITGFPGEEEEHFRHVLDFVQAVRFDHLGAFVYSPESDTPSAAMAKRPPRRVARERRRRLLEAQEPIALERRRRLVGCRLPTLVEGPCAETEHLLQGRHPGLAPEIDGRVLINDGTARAAALVEVEITEAYADDVVGRIVGPRGVESVQVADSPVAMEAGRG